MNMSGQFHYGKFNNHNMKFLKFITTNFSFTFYKCRPMYWFWTYTIMFMQAYWEVQMLQKTSNFRKLEY